MLLSSGVFVATFVKEILLVAILKVPGISHVASGDRVGRALEMWGSKI
jgi:hypothetical protein